MLGYMSKNFTEKEHSCKCGCGEVSRMRLIKKLQRVRDGIDIPLILNSSVRCDEHNDRVGGTSNSYHLKGLAVDICTLGMDEETITALREIAFDVGFRGIGVYDTFLHIDLREEAAFWTGRN